MNLLGMGVNRLAEIVITVAIVLVSTILHELAHAACALACGDPTAKDRGRLTLNPFAHLHPVGSVLLPILMALADGPVFAFAKPVPYNPRRLRHPVRDEVLVALAGPFCNLVQAGLGALALRLIVGHADAWPGDFAALAMTLRILSSYIYLNLSLMFFNLIPLPPLDGSAIISPLLRGQAREYYYRVQAYAMPVLLAVLYLVPMVFHVNPVAYYLNATAGSLFGALTGF